MDFDGLEKTGKGENSEYLFRLQEKTLPPSILNEMSENQDALVQAASS